MKKIAIIGASDFQNPLILKAKELGYETHVFAWKDGSIGEKTADYFYPISIIEKEKILKECEKINPIAITTIASDLATTTVNYIAEKLNLKGNSLECCEISTNKYKMRSAFKKNGIQSPGFVLINENKDLSKLNDLKYPLIVKPTDRSGSRAVTKIYNKKDLNSAINNAIDVSFEKCCIVEEFIEGVEYSLEGISFNGHHEFLTFTEKITTGEPHFIETGHIQPTNLSKEEKSKIKKIISKALDSLNIQNSATHSEFKITPDGNIMIIEIGARMGGDCIGSDLVELSTGIDYLKMVIDVACGNKPDFTIKQNPKIAMIKFILNENDLNKMNNFEKNNKEKIYFKSEITSPKSHNVIDSSSRFGFYILELKNKNELKNLI